MIIYVGQRSDFSLTPHRSRSAVPCPGGIADGTCPNGMHCISDTLCADESYLNWLRNQEASDGNGQQAIAESKPSPSLVAVATSPTSMNESNNVKRCSSHGDCQSGNFCNQPYSKHEGYCGECLMSGRGCSADEVCQSQLGCQQQAPGFTKCNKRVELDRYCEIRLNEVGAKCNVDNMVCERSWQQTTHVLTPNPSRRPTSPPTRDVSLLPFAYQVIPFGFRSLKLRYLLLLTANSKVG